MSQRSAPDERYWRTATFGIAALLVLQSAVFAVSVAVIDLDGPDFPLRAFLITTGISALAALLLLWQLTGSNRAIAWAAFATTGTWLAATVFEILLYSGVGIVW
ncbi:hypothetical protein OHB26_38455 [Nocardia sp. NBC_01503]|uniref:hypothetical protein n=1 Tax=Nocardia sp. NBC_01503 TaxID=2975997 RepID=UPI002E7B0421|nr:hypothetical protein [Nocardia sp. NBC_01503]WTL32662.1 hypothetical protein OHB26_38455 [Nocardia sp. NBC_01503]